MFNGPLSQAELDHISLLCLLLFFITHILLHNIVHTDRDTICLYLSYIVFISSGGHFGCSNAGISLWGIVKCYLSIYLVEQVHFMSGWIEIQIKSLENHNSSTFELVTAVQLPKCNFGMSEHLGHMGGHI